MTSSSSVKRQFNATIPIGCSRAAPWSTFGARLTWRNRHLTSTLRFSTWHWLDTVHGATCNRTKLLRRSASETENARQLYTAGRRLTSMSGTRLGYIRLGVWIESDTDNALTHSTHYYMVLTLNDPDWLFCFNLYYFALDFWYLGRVCFCL